MTLAVCVEHTPSERGGVLEKHRDQSLIARSLPEEAVAHAAGTNGVECGRAQLGQRRRGSVEQIGAPDTEAPRRRTRARRTGALASGWRVRSAGKKSSSSASGVERSDPAGSGKLRGPDDIELQDVRLWSTCVQPLHVELVPLIGGIGSDADLDPLSQDGDRRIARAAGESARPRRRPRSRKR